MSEYLLLVFEVCVGVQLLYFLLYAVVIGKHKRKVHKSDIPVSVVVCARNELFNLKSNLPFLLSQDYENYEVIVVNDRSTDGTYEYLYDLKHQHANFKLVQVDTVPDHINSKKYAITLGIKAAKYKKLLFTDADCIPNSSLWVQEMASQKSFVLGVSLYQKRKGLLNLFVRFETYLTAMQYIGNALLGKPYMGVGRNLGYDKNIFIDNKGFNHLQGIVGGDDDLFVNQYIARKNHEIVIGKNALVYSIPKTTVSSFFIQKIRHMWVGKYYKFSDKLVLGIFSLSFILFWISGGGLLFFSPDVVLIGYLGRLLVMWLLFFIVSKRFGERFVPLILPLLDFLYLFYYISVGTIAVLSKKVRWS